MGIFRRNSTPLDYRSGIDCPFRNNRDIDDFILCRMELGVYVVGESLLITGWLNGAPHSTARDGQGPIRLAIGTGDRLIFRRLDHRAWNHLPRELNA